MARIFISNQKKACVWIRTALLLLSLWRRAPVRLLAPLNKEKYALREHVKNREHELTCFETRRDSFLLLQEFCFSNVCPEPVLVNDRGLVLHKRGCFSALRAKVSPDTLDCGSSIRTATYAEA